jgi:hypothetical protein
MIRAITAADIPGDLVEAVADAVRLCRAADETTRAADVLDGIRRMHPGLDEADAKRAAGYAARMLDHR